jgi:hypothetical protein
MPSNVAIGEALNAVTSATEIAKLIAASDQSLEHVELKLKLADIISALADAKLQIAGFRDLLQARDEHIELLTESFAAKQSLVRHLDAIYRKNDRGKASGDPFCLRCWNEEQRQRPLLHTSDSSVRVCPVCKTAVPARLAGRLLPANNEMIKHRRRERDRSVANKLQRALSGIENSEVAVQRAGSPPNEDEDYLRLAQLMLKDASAEVREALEELST